MRTSRSLARLATRRVAVLLVAAGLAGACGTALRSTGIRLLYRQASAPPRVLPDVPYQPESTNPKHRLDLFVPAGNGWPVLIFIHGGGWTHGDKDLVVAGADVYGNIGRFFAGHGIGTVVANYRLQPGVTWREQVADIARVVAWTNDNIGRYGGDPRRLFLSGHSAGAQLSTFVALAPGPLEEVGLTPLVLCGMIPISGAGYDIADEETYRLGARRSYYEERFRAGDPGNDWLREASAMTYLSPEAPPFLLLHGAFEWKSLAYQNRLLDAALRDAGVESRLEVVPQIHQSIVLALTRDDRVPARAVLSFVRDTDCRSAPDQSLPAAP